MQFATVRSGASAGGAAERRIAVQNAGTLVLITACQFFIASGDGKPVYGCICRGIETADRILAIHRGHVGYPVPL